LQIVAFNRSVIAVVSHRIVPPLQRSNQRIIEHAQLRAKRSNPGSFRGKTLDCFVARAPRNDVERVCLKHDPEKCEAVFRKDHA
ncbi:hypothetical protein EAV90_36430, partial [Bradyrhizobium vignae]